LSLRVGRIIGVNIYLHFTWLIIFALITSSLAFYYMPTQYPNQPSWVYWTAGVAASVLLFLSVLFHELCHSYIAKKKGIKVSDITLFLFGGVARILEEPDSPDVEFKMSVAGPLSSFGLAVLFKAIWLASKFFNAGIEVLAPLDYGFLINLLLGTFNLVPAFPMDGGRILRAGLWRWKGNLLAATRIASQVGSGFAYLFMLLGFVLMFTASFVTGVWLIFIGWFLKSGAESSLKQTIISNALAEYKVKDVMTPEVHMVKPDTPVNGIVEHFFKYKHGGFPVGENDKMVGCVTMHDMKKVSQEKWGEVKAKDIMTPQCDIIQVSPEDPVVEAMVKMSKDGVGRLPVIQDGKLKGIITRSDLMKVVKIKTEIGGKLP
jgi:Zn-dependent protease/CBS domain-containing protein